MAGQNAFAYNGTAFVPENRELTASIKVRPAGSTALIGVSRVYKTSPALSEVWIGFPPAVESLTVSNNRSGTFPNLANRVVLSWTTPATTIISGFEIYYDAGSGFTKINASLVSSGATSYTVGNLPVGTHSFYVKSIGVNGLAATTTIQNITLSSASAVGTLSSSKTTATATVSWTVSSGIFQRFHIYDNATYLGEVLATSMGTSYSYTRTGLAQGTAYNFKVFGQNYDGFWSVASAADVTTNTLPIPSISWSDSNKEKYSDWSITWTAVSGITYQPEYYVTAWLNNGDAVTGTGSKTSATKSVSYGQTLYMRLKVSDAYVSGYTSQIQVTAGRPQVITPTVAGWGAETGDKTLSQTVTTPSTAFANGTIGQEKIWWGNENAIAVSSDANIERRVLGYSVTASKPTGVSGSLTSASRRLVINRNNSSARYEGFDGFSVEETYSPTHTVAFVGDRGVRTYYYGVRDAISTYRTVSGSTTWRYSDNQSNFWVSSRTKFEMTVTYRERSWIASVNQVTQTQVDSTYA